MSGAMFDTTAYVALAAGFTMGWLWLVAAHMFLRMIGFLREMIG